MISAPQGYVTHDAWSVGAVITYHPQSARLSVSRRDNLKRRGDHDGRVFPSGTAAQAFAAERGYVQPYRGKGAAWRSRHRWQSRLWAKSLHKLVLLAASRIELSMLAVDVRKLALDNGCDLLESQRYSLAPYTIARRLRPDLLES